MSITISLKTVQNTIHGLSRYHHLNVNSYLVRNSVHTMATRLDATVNTIANRVRSVRQIFFTTLVENLCTPISPDIIKHTHTMHSIGIYDAYLLETSIQK